MLKLARLARTAVVLSGSVFLGAAILIVSLPETHGCPPTACPGCPPTCLKLRCCSGPSDESCGGARDRRCDTAGARCGSDFNFECPFPAYYFYCGETCKRRDNGTTYWKRYLASWESGGPDTRTGQGKIGYRFECLPDPSFLGQGADCCDGAVKGGYFETRISVEVRLFLSGSCPGSPSIKYVKKEWYRRRTITREKSGSVPCAGEWTGDEIDPSAWYAAVEYPKDYECYDLTCHDVYVQVYVYVTFKQSGLALDQEPGGEVFVGEPVLDCLE